MLFKLLWWFDVCVAAVIVGFFVIGLGDGSVSSFNAGLWAAILVALSAVLWGGRALKAAGHPRTASAILSALAVPGLFAVVFFLTVVLTGSRWN